MAGPKSVLEATRLVQTRCKYQRPKSPRKIIEPRALEKKVRLFADTFAVAPTNKQLLSSRNVK